MEGQNAAKTSLTVGDVADMILVLSVDLNMGDEMSANVVGLEDVAALALRLSPLERVKLAERLMATVEQDLTALDEIEHDSHLLAEAKAQATGFVSLDEMLQDYTRVTGHQLNV